MRRLHLLALAAALALAVLVLLHHRGHGPDLVAGDSLDPALLQDRVWIDSRPEKYTDFTHAFLALSYAPLGVFQKASAYQSVTELFEYKRADRKVDASFPQSGKKRSFTYRISRCDDLPPFDLCLDLDRNPWGGPRRYHGLEDPSAEARLLPGLRHHLEHHLVGSP